MAAPCTLNTRRAPDVRITNQMILSRSLDSVRQGKEESARLERQIVTGRKFERLSGAPVDGRSVLELDADLRASDQFVRNMEAARARLSIADGTIDAMTNLLSRARELAVQGGSDVVDQDGRQAIQAEIQQIRDSIVQLANRSYNGAYVFGGVYSDQPPLDPSGALDPTFPARGAPSYEIGPGLTIQAAHDAGEMFIDTGAIASLDSLDVALGANDRAAIQASIGQLGDTIRNVQTLVADVGARQAAVDMAQSRQALIDETVSTRRSTLMDAPVEEAITRLVAVQSVYQAALLATTRLQQTSLVNYLR